MGKTTMLSSARLLALVASTAFLAEKCANACYGESCDFWVREWGVSCSLVESEIGCSCAGCACENPDTFEKNIRSFGRRTGTGTGSSTSAPTGAPTAAPTAAATTIVQVITTTFPDSVTTSNFNDGTGGYKAVCEAAYGVTLGIYTASSNTWDPDCAVSATASTRRGTLSITYTATISSAEASTATSQANSLTAATFNNAITTVTSAGTLSASGISATAVAAPTVTTSSSGASSTATVSILAFAAVLMAFNRA